MLNVLEDIKVGLDFLNGNSKNYIMTQYSLPFATTNENIDLYFPYFPINNGTVLTVASSGDHILEAVKNNSKKIYAFDINPFSLYVSMLKVAACKSLDYLKFIDFFYNENFHFFSKSYYKIIREYLDSKSRKFWDDMYYYGNLEDGTFDFVMLEHFRFNNSENSFRKEENYYSLQHKIQNANINYYHSDVFNILNFIPKNIQFDSIFLSNIFDWLKNNKKQYVNFIKSQLSTYLKKDGMIAVYVSSNGYYNSSLEKEFDDIINISKHNKVVTHVKK